MRTREKERGIPTLDEMELRNYSHAWNPVMPSIFLEGSLYLHLDSLFTEVFNAHRAGTDEKVRPQWDELLRLTKLVIKEKNQFNYHPNRLSWPEQQALQWLSSKGHWPWEHTRKEMQDLLSLIKWEKKYNATNRTTTTPARVQSKIASTVSTRRKVGRVAHESSSSRGDVAAKPSAG